VRYAPENPEAPIAIAAPILAPITILGLTVPLLYAPMTTPSIAIAPSKELSTKYLREIEATPDMLR
jgi:hypothetical protein